MADEIFRPRRPQNPTNPNEDQNMQEDQNEAFDPGVALRNQIAKEKGEDLTVPSEGAPFNIQGNAPPEFLKALKGIKSGESDEPKRGFSQMGKEVAPAPQKPARQISSGSDHLRELLEGLKGSATTYEEVELPSKGKFYDGENGPANGIVSIRPMTGEEEQILATPRFVRKGQAINMIFQRCIKENYRPENLLTIDRTYLLIYLRGISYSPSYDVEIKCPECDKKFSTTIDLNSLFVESCPDNYGPVLQDILPNTKLPFAYRLGTGKDEQDISDYRDRRIKAFGDSSADDTLTYRTSMLLDNIDGIDSKNELQILLKNLPINDVSYIRNCINEPPFGVDTDVEIICPSCLQDFTVDLPLESNFFFPRRKKGTTQV